MTTLRILTTLVLGDTWILPLGLAIMLIAAGLLRPLAAHDWAHLGGFVMLAAVLLILLVSVNSSARG